MNDLTTLKVDGIFKLVELLLVPFAWYVIKRLDVLAESLRAVSKDTSDLKTILIGVDGRNGIRSRVMRLERRVEALALSQAVRHGEPIVVAETLTEDSDDV